MNAILNSQCRRGRTSILAAACALVVSVSTVIPLAAARAADDTGPIAPSATAIPAMATATPPAAAITPQPATNAAPTPAGPATGEYQVQGDVENPGSFPFSGKQITIGQALTAAGVDAKADNLIVTLLRAGENGGTSKKSVSIGALANAKLKDEPLAPGDAIIVEKDARVAGAAQPQAAAAMAANQAMLQRQVAAPSRRPKPTCGTTVATTGTNAKQALEESRRVIDAMRRDIEAQVRTKPEAQIKAVLLQKRADEMQAQAAAQGQSALAATQQARANPRRAADVAPAARPQSVDIDALNQRIDALSRKVDELQKKLDEKNHAGQTPDAAPKFVAPAPTPAPVQRAPETAPITPMAVQ